MKSKIAQAALALCREKGLEGASIAEIASSCGLRKSSIYSHYASKAEIENEVLSLCQATLVEGVGRLQIEKGDIHTALASSALMLMEVLAGGQSGLCHALVQAEKFRNPKAAEIDRQLFNMARARIEVLFDLKLNPLDSALPAFLFCAALERLASSSAQRRSGGGNAAEMLEETEDFCEGFLKLTFSQEMESPQG